MTNNNPKTDYIERAIATTFGFELETSFSPGRKEAAEIIRAVIGGTPVFESGYCYGNVKYATTDPQGRTWEVHYDGSVDGTSAEIVSPPITMADLPVAIAVIRAIRTAGAKGGPNNGCGLHIHIDGKDFAEDGLRLKNLAQQWIKWEPLWLQFAKTSSKRLGGSYCHKWADTRMADRFMKLAAHPEIADIRRAYYDSATYTPTHGDSARYYTLNLNNLFCSNGSKTIEFRLFETCLDNPRLLEAYVYALMSFVQRIKEMKRSGSKYERKDNLTDEYQFGFMLHLKGEKYKFVRDLIKHRMRKAGEGLHPTTRIRVERR